MAKTYTYTSFVTIGDTNILQNLYFSNYFVITGKVRELWVRDCVKKFDESLRGDLILGTRRTSCEYFHDFFLFDKMIIKMQFTWIKNVSTEIIFKFYRNQSKEVHAEVYQTIVFLNRCHRLVRIPNNFKEAILEYIIDR